MAQKLLKGEVVDTQRLNAGRICLKPGIEGVVTILINAIDLRQLLHGVEAAQELPIADDAAGEGAANTRNFSQRECIGLIQFDDCTLRKLIRCLLVGGALR